MSPGAALGMEAYRIGQQLRDTVLRDRHQGRPLDPRRLQAVIEDLCGAGEPDLAAPLRYLVLSAAFISAAGMDPPLSDGRQLSRLQNELTQTFAPSLCARMQPLLGGLLGLPDPGRADAGAAASPGDSANPGADRSVQGPLPGGGGVAPRSGGVSVAMVMLAFLSGLLLMALALIGLLLWQHQRAAVVDRSAGAPEPRGLTPEPLSPVPSAQAPSPDRVPQAANPVAVDQSPDPQDRAVGGIQQLYAALSAKDFNQAQSFYSGAAADQFDPGFFRQFERVTVQDLQTTSQTGSTVNLEGQVTFVWPDGSLQRETRTFSVDTSHVPAVITESEFGRVIKSRW